MLGGGRELERNGGCIQGKLVQRAGSSSTCNVYPILTRMCICFLFLFTERVTKLCLCWEVSNCFQELNHCHGMVDYV